MRVLYITGEFPPMQGGVGDYTHALGAALAGSGVDVHVLTSRQAGPAPLVPLGACAVYPDVTTWGWGLARRVRALVSVIEADIVHIQYQSAAYDLHPAINLLPRRLRGRRWPRHVVTTFHDLRVPYLFPKAGPLRWRANLELARRSDRAIVTNAEDYNRLSQIPELSGRLIDIPIGANVEPEPPPGFDRTAQRARWGIRPDELLVCYFGFLNDSKGGEELMLATALLCQAGIPVHLLMIGGQLGASDPTNAAYLQRVQALIVEQGIVDRVHWTGFTDKAEVSANLLASDIAVLPYRDGASLRRGSLMAAIAHGLPIVSTRPVVPIPEIKAGENMALAPVHSPPALAEAILQLWRDPAARQRLSQGALTLSRLFTWDSIARRHQVLYQDLTLRQPVVTA
jgi:glycosyltransferase involved in cell wall biosynthesis